MLGSVENLRVADDRRHEVIPGVSFEIRAGEILGVAGVAGNGQDELVEAITGLRKPAGGKVFLGGNDVTGFSPRRMNEAGVGYVPADRNFDAEAPIGTIPVDSAHSPVRRVNYHVEAARIGQATDYDRLVLEVWTNGTISPEDAVAYAARIAVQAEGGLFHFGKIVDGIAIQHQAADFDRWKVAVRPDLGNVENIKTVILGLFGRHDLHLKRP